MNSAIRLRVTLVGVDPLVWRRVLVAGTITLPMLHQIFQVLMGWDDYHLYAFKIKGERYGVPDADWGPTGELNERGVRLSTDDTPRLSAHGSLSNCSCT